MSSPENQRADGCSVFFTFLCLCLLGFCLFLIHDFFSPEAPVSVTEAIESKRRDKVAGQREASDAFASTINSYHQDKNSSIEDSMIKTIHRYQSLSSPNPRKN